jgi:hypothetical protein
MNSLPGFLVNPHGGGARLFLKHKPHLTIQVAADPL